MTSTYINIYSRNTSGIRCFRNPLTQFKRAVISSTREQQQVCVPLGRNERSTILLLLNGTYFAVTEGASTLSVRSRSRSRLYLHRGSTIQSSKDLQDVRHQNQRGVFLKGFDTRIKHTFVSGCTGNGVQRSSPRKTCAEFDTKITKKKISPNDDIGPKRDN